MKAFTCLPISTLEELDYLQMFRLLGQRLLHHYTDAVGLQGIIQSNCLRASAARYLNDSSEVDYGCSIVTDVIEDWLEKNESNRHLLSPAMRVLELLRGPLGDPESGLRAARTSMSGAFAKMKILLSQWRAYGRFAAGIRSHLRSS